METFWNKVERAGEDECWVWQAGLSKYGYGRFGFRGANWQAHRVAYTLTSGEIPKGEVIMHLCNNRKCCNPKHLKSGTQDENNKYTSQSGRHVAVAPRVFTPEEVLTIVNARTYREAALVVKANHKAIMEVRRVHKERGTQN